MKPSPNATLLFHLSDELRTSFTSANGKRPTFYWFNDTYHSHILGDKPSARYMHFFVVKPNSGVKLFTGHGNGDFASMWRDHTEYRLNRIKNHIKSVAPYNEPAIVLSFSELVPDFIAEFKGDDHQLSIIRPEGNLVSFNLKENGHFRLFNQIPELVNLCPDIRTAVPLLQPSPGQVNKPDTFWSPDIEHQGKMWL